MSEPVKGPPTSTAAELQAAARAINIAGQRGISNLRVFTDSQTVCTAMEHMPDRRDNNWQKFNTFKKQWESIDDRNNFELLESAIKKYPTMKVEFVHVRGHSGNQHNMEAHLLAKEGAKQYHTGYY